MNNEDLFETNKKKNKKYMKIGENESNCFKFGKVITCVKYIYDFIFYCFFLPLVSTDWMAGGKGEFNTFTFSTM